MKTTFKQFISEATEYEWRPDTRGGGSAYSLVLYSKYKGKKDFEYSAEFVKAHETTWQFKAQKVSYHGDSISWGGADNTPQKDFKTRAEVNAFLKKIGRPEISDNLFNEVRPVNSIVLAIDGNGSYHHYFTIGPVSLKNAKEASSTEDDFLRSIAKLLTKPTAHWLTRVSKPEQFTKETLKLLKDFYSAGTVHNL